jgi:hypothetical protein
LNQIIEKWSLEEILTLGMPSEGGTHAPARQLEERTGNRAEIGKIECQ